MSLLFADPQRTFRYQLPIWAQIVMRASERDNHWSDTIVIAMALAERL
jgi:hypothetical protein